MLVLVFVCFSECLTLTMLLLAVVLSVCLSVCTPKRFKISKYISHRTIERCSS